MLPMLPAWNEKESIEGWQGHPSNLSCLPMFWRQEFAVRSQAEARRDVGIVPTILIGEVFLAGMKCGASALPCMAPARFCSVMHFCPCQRQPLAAAPRACLLCRRQKAECCAKLQGR
jgi:hypothetical protein